MSPSAIPGASQVVYNVWKINDHNLVYYSLLTTCLTKIFLHRLLEGLKLPFSI